MAAQYSANSHIAALEYAMTFNGGEGIGRTGGSKATAWREKGRDEVTVPLDNKEDPFFNYHNSFDCWPESLKLFRTKQPLAQCNRDTARSISAGLVRVKSERTVKTMSDPAGKQPRLRRKDSRIILFNRFRLTAPLIRRWILIPILLKPRPLGRVIRAKPLPRSRFPCL